MFRVKLKKQIIAILNDFYTLHKEIEHSDTSENRLKNLAIAQDTAVRLGNQIEKLVDNSQVIIDNLSSYCEILYLMAKENRIDSVVLDQKIDKVIQAVNDLPSIRIVYFLPYKASMWDSLESIYLAAAKDVSVKAVVMPIPYYEFDNVHHSVQEHYEGCLFSKEIPITDYKDVDLSVIHPDVIYIHNPYDHENIVTSVKPDYYSDRLKSQTDCLIYVPYYVTCGFFAKDQQYAHVMRNISWMIVQSQHFKDDAKSMPYYDHLLPMGSPKLDKVIRTCTKFPLPHPEWKEFIADRKTIMLNTSLGVMLHDTNAYLTKLEHLFDYFNSRKDIALIWRPHPLLRATLQAARTKYVSRYDLLVKHYISNNIGIFDTSPSIEDTIAVSDAYIGDNSTSVVNLFGASGKPLFILNNYILRAPSNGLNRRIHLRKILPSKDNQDYVVTDIGLCKTKSGKFSNLEYIGSANSSDCWHNSTSDAVLIDDRIYLAPYLSRQFAYWDTRANMFFKPDDPRQVLPVADPIWSDVLRFSHVFNYGKTLCFFPEQAKSAFPDSIIVYNSSSHHLSILTEPLEAWKSNASAQDLASGISISYAFQENGSRYIYAIAPYSSLILRFDIKTEDYRFLQVIEDDHVRFLVNAVVGDLLLLVYLTNSSEKPCVSLLLHDLTTGTNQTILLPYEDHLWESGIQQYDPISALISVGDDLYLIPKFTDLFFKVSLTSRKVKSILPGLFEPASNDVLGYSKSDIPICSFAQYIPSRGIYLQRSYDNALFLLRPAEDEVEELVCGLSDRSIERIHQESDGFEKDTIDSEFSQKEGSLFTLNAFLDDLTGNPEKMAAIKQRQLAELQPLAANLDGTCGIKTHNKIMEILDNS